MAEQDEPLCVTVEVRQTHPCCSEDPGQGPDPERSGGLNVAGDLKAAKFAFNGNADMVMISGVLQVSLKVHHELCRTGVVSVPYTALNQRCEDTFADFHNFKGLKVKTWFKLKV